MKQDHFSIISSKAGISKKDAESMTRWLGDQLISQQFAKLNQGGHAHDQIALKQVFVDLPTALSNSPSEEDRELILNRLANAASVEAKFLLEQGALSFVDQKKGSEARTLKSAEFSAVLLIGGPGQGKSTIGQLFSQSQRATLLKYSRHLTEEQKKVAESFNVNLLTGSAKNKPPVLPLQIDLPNFANWLAKTDVSTTRDPLILRHLTDSASAKMYGVTPGLILALSRVVEVVVILDGFDEVGSREERHRLVAETKFLVRALAEKDARIRVLVTTRPQGYEDEFDSVGFNLTKAYLLPLKPAEAREYAHKLVMTKVYGRDEQQRAIKHIDEAAEDVATQRIFTTPLQVTIITALVQHLGRAPRERWNLFHRYFNFMYEREVERTTFATSLLRDHRTHIEKIHARIGLLLQTRSEEAGGAKSVMARSEFEEVILQVLKEDETPEDRSTELIGRIATAAENRLVFLVQPEPDSYGFEIRSLQEFFAAWCITTGRESDVTRRLQKIRRSPIFKNVMGLASSYIFSSRQELRDMWVDEICRPANDSGTDAIGAETKYGSYLALESLEEGTLTTQPKYGRLLMRIAVQLLEKRPGPEHVRIIQASNKDTESEIEQILFSILIEDNSNNFNVGSAWVVLLELMNKGKTWESADGRKHWTIVLAESAFKSESIAVIVDSCERSRTAINSWLAEKFFVFQEYIDPADILSLKIFESSQVDFVSGLIKIFSNDRLRSWWRSPPKINDLVSSDEKLSFLSAESVSDHRWRAWVSIAAFEELPSAERLAVALENIAEAYTPDQYDRKFFRCSWPFQCCLKISCNSDDIKKISKDLRHGVLGNSEDWISAQKEWALDGVLQLTEVVESTYSNTPWNVELLKKAPPLQAFPHVPFYDFASPAISKVKIIESAKRLHAIWISSNSNQMKKICATLVLQLLQNVPRGGEVGKWELDDLVRSAHNAIGFLSPKPRSVSKQKWKRLLDVGIDSEDSYWVGSISQLIDVVIESEFHPAIMIMGVNSFGVTIEIDDIESIDREERESFLTLVSQRIEKSDFDKNLLIWQAVLSTSLGSNCEISSADFLANLKDHVIFFILSMVRQNCNDPAVIERALLETVDKNKDLLNSFIIQYAFREAVSARRSGLSKLENWLELNLPLPSLHSSAGAKKSSIYGEVSHIKNIEIKNVRGIKYLNANFNIPENPDQGQWIIIIGENGVGKTTLLRCIALALRDVEDLSIWPQGAFTSEWRTSATQENNFISTVRVDINPNLALVTKIQAGSRYEQTPEHSNIRQIPLLGYGCQRGGALGGPKGRVPLGTEGGPDIVTLFDPSGWLINAESWLIHLEARSFKEPAYRDIFPKVCEALALLLDVKEVFVEKGEVVVTEEEGAQTISMNFLSDGYLATAGWFIDLLARWIDICALKKIPLAKNFLEDIRLIVLIDEIDIHLHPQWQREVVSRTRALLPKCTFVVTTHNPLTLAGAKADEIYIIERNDEIVSINSGRLNPAMLTGGQIYKQYFGVGEVLPTDAVAKSRRYDELSEKENLTKEEIIELSQLKSYLDAIGVGVWEN